MFSGRRSASTAAEKGQTLANCSNSIGKESIVLQYFSGTADTLLIIRVEHCSGPRLSVADANSFIP